MEQDPPPPRAPKLPLPIVTIVLIATNIAAWVFSLSAGADPLMPNPELMFDLGGNFGPATFDGESWRLLSSMFLHFGIIHLGMNMFGLGLGGRLVEPAFGRAGFTAIYLFSGLTGGLASAIAGKAVAAGASGAIFGIFGAWPAFLLLHHKRFDKETLTKQSSSFAIFLAANLGIGLSSSTIDLRAHIGGLIGGFLAGLVLASHKHHTARLVAVFAASALAIGAAYVIPAPEQTVLRS